MNEVLLSLESRAAARKADAKDYKRLDIVVIDVVDNRKFDFVGESKDGEKITIEKCLVVYRAEGSDKEFSSTIAKNSLANKPDAYTGTSCVGTFVEYTDKEGASQWALNHISKKAIDVMAIAKAGGLFAIPA